MKRTVPSEFKTEGTVLLIQKKPAIPLQISPSKHGCCELLLADKYQSEIPQYLILFDL